MTTLEIGTLKIDNPIVEQIIKNYSQDELKKIIISSLETTANQSFSTKKQKGKWGEVVKKMKGTLTKDDVKYLQDCSKEFRSNFILREYN